MPTVKWSIIVFLVLVAVVTYFEQAPKIKFEVQTKVERGVSK